MGDTGRGDGSDIGGHTAGAQAEAVPTGGDGPGWCTVWTSGADTDARLRRTLAGHGGPVTAVAAAVAGGRAMAVSASRDTTVRVWDVKSGQQLHRWSTGPIDPLSSMTAEVLALAVAEVDGRPLVFGAGTDEAVRVRDLATGRPVGEIVALVECAAVNGRAAVLTMDATRTLQVWDAATGQLLGSHSAVLATGVVGGRRIAVSAPGIRPVEVWDIAANTRIDETCQVLHAAVGMDGTARAETAADGATPRLWDLSSGLPVAAPDLPWSASTELFGVEALAVVDGRAVAVTLDYQDEPELLGDLAAEGHDAALARRTTTVHLDGRRIALVAGADLTLHRWDLTDLRTGDGPRAFRTVPDGQRHAEPTPGPSGQPDLWDVISTRRNGGLATRPAAGPGEAPTVATARHGRAVVLTAAKDGTVTADATAEPPLTGHTDRVWALDTVTDGTTALAVTTGLDRTVRIWDTATGRQLGEPLAGHTGQVWDVATALVDGRPVAVTAGDDHTVRVWHPGPPAEARQAEDGEAARHTADVLALTATHLDGCPVAVTAGADRTVRTWDLETGRPAAAPLRTETTAVTAVETGGRTVLVCVAPDATVHTLDPLTGLAVHRPVGTDHGRVLAVAAAVLDGRPVVLTAGSDRTTGVRDLATGEPVLDPLTGHTSRVTAVTTTLLGGRPVAVTGSWDRTVRVWDLTTGRPIGEPLTGHTDWVTSVSATTICGTPVVATTGREGVLRLWDLTSMAPIGSVGSAGAPAVLVASGGGAPLAAVAEDRAVRFLDPVTGRSAAPDRLLPLPVRALAAAPGGRLLAAFGPHLALLAPH
ncbi:WD40 repeat domain-containing protein [Kitasatospora sp. NPDC085879]|uniref:WD40 repeat domain-containing protein n=1 Tax=Kitasatospora sp. NPDC085879 TaxID=3154769 RepID=UPI00341489ED